MRIAEAFVELRVDTRKARAEAVAETKKIGQEMSSVLADAFSAAAFAGAVNSIIQQASRLEQSIGAVESVFGDARGAVETFAKTSATAYGISAAAARELTSQTGALLKGLGMTTKEAADQSVVIARLGADLSAAFGGRPEEAVQALGAALRGEFNPAERFGVSLTAISVATKAVEMGLADSVTQVDGYARAQATLALITEQTADVQGQFARESDTAAGAAARARAEFENQRAELGQQLLPVYAEVLDLLSGLVGAFTDLPQPAQMAILAMGGIVAMAGPMGRVVDTAGKLKAALAGLSTTQLGIGAGLVAAAALYSMYTSRKDEAAEATRKFADALEAEAAGQEDAIEKLIGEELTGSGLVKIMEELGFSAEEAGRVIKGETVPAFEELERLADLALTGYSYEDKFGLEAERLGITATSDEIITLVDKLNLMEQGLSDARSEEELVADVTAEVTTGMGGAADAADHLAGQVREVQSAAESAADKIGFFQQALEELRGGAISLEESNRALRDGFDAMAASVTENGATLDINTDQGRRNREVVQEQVDAIFEHAEAMIESGSTMKEAGQAAEDLRAFLIDSMEQMGFSREEAEAYIETLGLTPENVETAVELTKQQKAKQDVEKWIDKLDEIDAEVPTDVQALIDEGKYAEARRRIDELTAPRVVQIEFNPVGDGNIARRLPIDGATPVVGSTSWWQQLIGQYRPATSSGTGGGMLPGPDVRGEDPVQAAFDQAAADQRAIESRQARRKARRNVISTAMDPEASPAEKKAAEKQYADAIFDDLDARANRRGIDDRTVEWANFMRSGLGAAMKKYPFLRDEIRVLLAGIPDFSGEGMGASGGGIPGGGGGPSKKPRKGTLGGGSGGSTPAAAGMNGPIIAVFGAEDRFVEQIDRKLRQLKRSTS